MIMKHALHSEGPLFIGFIYIKLCFEGFFLQRAKWEQLKGILELKAIFFFFFCKPQGCSLAEIRENPSPSASLDFLWKMAGSRQGE